MNTVKVPARDEDPLLTLYAHYYLPAELMFENYKRLLNKWQKQGRLAPGESLKYRIYFGTWLGLLGVVTEGFKQLAVRKLIQDARPSDFIELVPECNALGRLLNKHDSELRKFRNKIFHLRDTATDIIGFLTAQGRLEWAEEVQSSFKKFFSNYRVFCEVHYILQGEVHRKSLH